jgi:hypothetical protein
LRTQDLREELKPRESMDYSRILMTNCWNSAFLIRVAVDGLYLSSGVCGRVRNIGDYWAPTCRQRKREREREERGRRGGTWSRMT